MPSGWDVYYVVFLSAVLSLGVPAGLGLVAYLFTAKKRRISPDTQTSELNAKHGEPQTGSSLGRRMNTRVFLGANAALVLIALGLVLIPCVTTLREDSGNFGIVRGLIGIVSVAGFTALALLYASRKGDLNWLGTFQSRKPKREGRGR